MKNKHNNFKRIMGRIAEEIKSTYQIAKETSIIKAIKTLIAKIFQISSDKIGCFFDDEHFNKIEEKFSPVAIIADHIV